MRTLYFAFSFESLVLFALPFPTEAQDGEVPVTTSSYQALEYFIAGREKFENFDIASASGYFDLALQADTNFALAYYYLPLTPGKIHRPGSSLLKAVSLAGEVSKGERNMILYAYATVTQNSEARKDYLDLLLNDFPLDKRIRTEAGNYYFNLQNYTKALEQYNRAHDLDPKYAPALFAIAYTLWQQENYEAADSAFIKLIQLMPKGPAPYDTYGKFLLKMGRYDQSIAQYKKALEYEPYYSYSLVGLGDNYVFKGDYIRARKYYRDYYYRAPTLHDKYDALHWEAVSYIYEGDIDKVLATYDLYYKLAEQGRDAYHAVIALASQGQVLVESGNPTQGMKKYDKAMALIRDAERKVTTKEIETAAPPKWKIYAPGSDGDSNFPGEDQYWCIQRVENKKDISDRMFLNSISWTLDFNKGQYDFAVVHYSKADPEDPLTAYYIAMAYNKKGDRQNATKLFEKISKSNDNSINLALARNKSIYRQLNCLSYTK